MPANDDKQALTSAIQERILNGPGTATPALRQKAFENDGLPEPLAGLLDKVDKLSFQVTEGDFTAALAAGYSEDQLFELVICAGVGASSRLYQAGLEALREAAS